MWHVCIYLVLILPAVYKYWSFVRLVLSFDPPEVVEDWASVLWYTMVRPRGEVILHHFA